MGIEYHNHNHYLHNVSFRMLYFVFVICLFFLVFFVLLFCLGNGLNTQNLYGIRGFSDSNATESSDNGIEKSLIDIIDDFKIDGFKIDGVTRKMVEDVFLDKKQNQDSFVEWPKNMKLYSMLRFLEKYKIGDSVAQDQIATLMIKHYKATQEQHQKVCSFFFFIFLLRFWV